MEYCTYLYIYIIIIIYTLYNARLAEDFLVRALRDAAEGQVVTPPYIYIYRLRVRVNPSWVKG